MSYHDRHVQKGTVAETAINATLPPKLNVCIKTSPCRATKYTDFPANGSREKGLQHPNKQGPYRTTVKFKLQLHAVRQKKNTHHHIQHY